MNNIEIRPRTRNDINALAQVLIRVHARDGYPVEGVANPAAWLAPPHELAAWTALVDHNPIGQISLTKATENDDAAILWRRITGGNIQRAAIPVRLFVDPDYRQSGAGGLLMGAAYTYATERHLTVVFDVMLKDSAAIRLYERAGCQRLGTITHKHSGGKTEAAAVYVAPKRDQSEPTV